MAGWCCCDHWEHWDNWAPEDFDDRQGLVARSDVPAARPSELVMWLNGSDNPPPPDVEEMYLKVEKDLLGRIRWSRPRPQSPPRSPAPAA